MLDRTSRICFSSVFQKKAWIILYKTDPDLIWVVWSGFGQMHLVWKQAGEEKSFGPVFGRTQPACYQFPAFRLGFVHVQNQPGSSLVLADCVRFEPNGSSPGASQCARIIQPAFGHASQLIWTGCELDPAYLLGMYLFSESLIACRLYIMAILLKIFMCSSFIWLFDCLSVVFVCTRVRCCCCCHFCFLFLFCFVCVFFKTFWGGGWWGR